jgi:hypothetical protein
MHGGYATAVIHEPDALSTLPPTAWHGENTISRPTDDSEAMLSCNE